MVRPPKIPDHWGNTCPAWVCCPTYVWAEISSGYKIHLDARYRAIERLLKGLIEWSTAEEVLKMEDYTKIFWAGLQWMTVEQIMRKREFSLPKNLATVIRL